MSLVSVTMSPQKLDFVGDAEIDCERVPMPDTDGDPVHEPLAESESVAVLLAESDSVDVGDTVVE